MYNLLELIPWMIEKSTYDAHNIRVRDYQPLNYNDVQMLTVEFGSLTTHPIRLDISAYKDSEHIAYRWYEYDRENNIPHHIYIDKCPMDMLKDILLKEVPVFEH